MMRGEKGGVIAKLKGEVPNILDIGGCCLHHVHNSACKAVEKLDISHIEEFLEDLFLYLRNSKSAKAFEEFQKLLDMEPLKFLRHISSRWLQIYDVVSRLVQLYDALKSFFDQLPATEKRRKRVQDIVITLNSHDTIIYLHFLLFALQPLKDFEILFQKSDSVIHLLYGRIIDLISHALSCFVKQQHVDDLKDLKQIDDIPRKKQLPDHELLIGRNTRLKLRNDHLTATQVALFYERVRSFFVELVKAFLHYLPFTQRLIRAVQFIDPSRKNGVSEEDIVYAAKKLGVSCDSDRLLLEWRLYLSEQTKEEVNIPEFWISSSHAILREVAQRALILPHGNADTERLMSWLKRIVTEERNRLQDTSLNGLMSVKSYLISRGITSDTFEICQVLRVKCRNAKAAYEADLRQRKENEKAKQVQKELEISQERARKEALKRKEEDQKAAEELASKKRKLAEDYLAEAQKLMAEASAISKKPK